MVAVGTFTSIAAVGLSIESMLNSRLAAAFAQDHTLFRRRPKAQLVHTEEFDRSAGAAGRIADGTVSIFCYRVDVNRTMRPPWSQVGAATNRVHIPVDVHFLLTAWDTDAEAELRLLGFTLLALETTPSLSGPLLHPLGRWEPGESVQLVNEELLTEDVLRTFETLPTDFRLSVAYAARVVRLDSPLPTGSGDVVTAVAGLTPEGLRP